MFEVWIWLGFFGGAFQAFRIAGQRVISSSVSGQNHTPSIWASPLSRVFAGVPIAAIVLYLGLRTNSISLGQWCASLNLTFFLWISAAALLQLFATIVQTSLVKRRNFAVGVIYLKVMVPAQALFGVILFGEQFTALQWAALVLVTVGVFVLGKARSDRKEPSEQSAFDWTSLWMGLVAGVVLAFTGLFIREANLELELDDVNAVVRGMTSLLVLAIMQLSICTFSIALNDASEFRDLAKRYKVVLFTGLMSVGGSSCWFIGFALASPALVNAVGQSEFLFAMLLSLFFFYERPTRAEWFGTTVVLIGIIVLLLSGSR